MGGENYTSVGTFNKDASLYKSINLVNIWIWAKFCWKTDAKSILRIRFWLMWGM